MSGDYLQIMDDLRARKPGAIEDACEQLLRLSKLERWMEASGLRMEMTGDLRFLVETYGLRQVNAALRGGS